MPGRWARDSAAAQAPPHRHLQRGDRGSGLRAELRSAGSSRGGTEGETGGAAGGNAAPSLRASATAATAKEEGAEHRGQAPQPSSQPLPPRARARAPQPGGSRGTCARSPAASVDALEARAPPTPNGKRAPAPPAPTNRYTPRAARGRAASAKVPPAAVRLVPRCEGGAGSPEAVDLLSRPSRRAGKRMRGPWSFRPGKAGRKRERTWR